MNRVSQQKLSSFLALFAACSPSQLPAHTATNTVAPKDTPQPTSITIASIAPSFTPKPTAPPTPTPQPTSSSTPTLAPVGPIRTIPQGLVYLGDKKTLALGFGMRAGGSIGSLLYNGRELVDRTDYGRYVQLSFYDGNQKYLPLGNDPYGNWGWNPVQAGSKAGGGSIRWNICLLFDQPRVGYIGPVAYFDVPPKAVREIDYYLIPGPIEAARGIVYDLILHTNWTFDLNSFEGWQGTSTENTVKNGILTTHLSPNSFLTSAAGLNVSGAIASTVAIKARAQDGDANICLQFITSNDPNWDVNKSSCVTLTAGQFQAKNFSVKENAIWSESVITQIRLTVSKPAVVEIDSIQVEINGQAWEFESEGNAEGWSAWNQLDSFQANRGNLTAQSTGDDPYMGSQGLAIDAKALPIIKIRMAVSSGRSAQLYFITSSHSVYDESKSMQFPVNADGEFHVYTLDMSTIRNWQGTITQIRLDPVDAKSSIMVDYVRIMKRQGHLL